jgi:DsbC/DsbD-like thiol-disulfide interchange protein
VNVASISYDSQAALGAFAQAHQISYPLLADQGSAVIRSFGILNTNVPADVSFYGIPFPGDYLIAPDGTVKEKIFLDDYQERAAASEVLLRNFGAGTNGLSAEIKTDDVRAKISLSDAESYSGIQLGVAVEFAINSGWHIYGEPLPSNYTPVAITFDADLVTSQNIALPAATPVEFKELGETLPVYSGELKASGKVLLKQKLKAGDYKLGGTIQFQECSDTVCKIPQRIRFELPLRIDPMAPSAAQMKKSG